MSVVELFAEARDRGVDLAIRFEDFPHRTFFLRATKEGPDGRRYHRMTAISELDLAELRPGALEAWVARALDVPVPAEV